MTLYAEGLRRERTRRPVRPSSSLGTPTRPPRPCGPTAGGSAAGTKMAAGVQPRGPSVPGGEVGGSPLGPCACGCYPSEEGRSSLAYRGP